VRRQNRWTRWARDLRSRHGRRELRRMPGSMVLSRGAGAFTRLLVSVRRTLVHIDARFAVTRVLAPATTAGSRHALLRPSATRVIHRVTLGGRPGSTAGLLRGHPPRASTPSIASPMLISSRHRGGGPVRPETLVLTERAAPRRWRTGTWQDPSSTGIGTRDAVAMLRRRAARQELVVADTTRVLAGTRSDNAPSARAGTSCRAEAVAVLPADAAGPATFAPVAPAINVESLTSQVIQQLDRRLIAYRERMGRA
jgi:hypothetical protein